MSSRVCMRPRTLVIASVAVLATAVALAASTQTRGSAPPKPQSAAAVLGGTSWQLVKFESGQGKTFLPDDRTKYTVAFAGDGTLAVRVDCNRGTGTWKSPAAGQITFGPLALTRAACPEGSMHDQIVKNWSLIRGYVIQDGNLYLSLSADGGIYEFEKYGG